MAYNCCFYEFVCSGSDWTTEKHDSNNLLGLLPIGRDTKMTEELSMTELA